MKTTPAISTGASPGKPPYTLLDFFPKDYLLFVDESHVTLPQVRAMYNGDTARKDMLVKYGFRLPAAYDNRPLQFHEFNERINQAIYVSATPAEYERELAGKEPYCRADRPPHRASGSQDLRPAGGKPAGRPAGRDQDDGSQKGYSVLVTTLTKKLAERLTDYYAEMGIRVRYMHSDIDTMERIEIIRGLRLKEFDVLVGINLLREGLDIPEVALVAILDADKEGFLRNETSLIQTIGRAARNAEGRVILYADVMTRSIKSALCETDRRRRYRRNITKSTASPPTSISKEVSCQPGTLPAMAEEASGSQPGHRIDRGKAHRKFWRSRCSAGRHRSWNSRSRGHSCGDRDQTAIKQTSEQ